MMERKKKQYMSLKGKLIGITSGIFVVTIVILTILLVQNAKATYGNEFKLQIGNGISFSMNDNGVNIDGNNDLNEILSFIDKLGKGKDTERGPLQKANLDFARKSILCMIGISLVSLLIISLVVNHALKPMKQLEESIRNVNERNLNQPVSVATKEREIISLESSFNTMITKLDGAFQMQKNFAANAAHELKTPLTTMKAGIQVLQLEGEPTLQEYRETIDVVEQSTERLIHVVEDLLNLTREEENGYGEHIHLQELVDIVVDELMLTAQEKQVNMEVRTCTGEMYGNSTLLYRVIFNLVENAIKYNRPGGNVYVESFNSPDGTVNIVIADQGIGMKEEELQHIFEPFYRVDKSRSRQMGGSGLGLSIVKKIVEKHYGTISVNSIPMVGTTFHIQFPSEH
ncbi:sensor histidine kinase [Anaerosporobacter faecicola]|uniref:sensor histidine kinase n=1 Tax=Anaerosporobacter faecicola TaxID=2718714 RepID=UPI00143C47C5|nr:HAMP domain-containing sensor histidine kinase [Anaerosporobacter faecicola]